MPLYKMRMQIQGPHLLLADHVYELDERYAQRLNAEKDGKALEPWDPSMEVAAEKVHEAEPSKGDGLSQPKTAPLRGDAWRRKGQAKGRLSEGI